MWSAMGETTEEFSMKARDIRSFYDYVREFRVELGHETWSGAEAMVWDLGNFVLKLAVVRPDRIRDLRMLVASRGCEEHL